MELTKYTWKLKTKCIKYNIQWEVADKVYGNANSRMCKLCLTVKLWMIDHINHNNILNKNSEVITKCIHLNKFLLKHVIKQ